MVWDGLFEAGFADLMAETSKPPVEGRGDRSFERDDDPDAPRAAPGSADIGRGGPDATVTASAQLPELDQRALVALGDVGRGWAGCMPAREVWERALPVDRGSISPIRSARAPGASSTSAARGAETTGRRRARSDGRGGGGRFAVGPRGLRAAPGADRPGAAQHGDRRGAHGARCSRSPSSRPTRSPRWPTGRKR